MKKFLVLFLLTAAVLSAQSLSGLRFCIDPGHGGHDPANDRYIAATGFWESEGNWDKANYLKDILEGLGAYVVVTRNGNDDSDDLALSQRAAIANAHNVDFFNSIHSNGWQGNSNSTLVLFRGYDNQPVFSESKQMASHLASDLKATNRTTGKSVRGDWSFYPDWGTSGLGVLRTLSMTGTLTEGSFHDYIPESWRLMNTRYRKHEAIAISRSFLRHYSAGSEEFGAVAGLVRDPNENVTYNYIVSSDQKKPVNGLEVYLENGTGKTYGDYFNNGFYIVDSLTPGNYKLYIKGENYAIDSVDVTVVANRTIFKDKFLNYEPDFTNPEVLSVSPVDDTENVSLKAALEFNFSKIMNTADVQNAITISPSVPGSYSWTTGNKKLVITPTDNLFADTEYHVTIDTTAHSFFNVGLTEKHEFSFKTRGKLTMLSQYPYDEETNVSTTVEFRLDFDAPIDKTTLSGNIAFYDADGNKLSVKVLTALYEEGKIYFGPKNELPAESRFRIELGRNIGDTEGLTYGVDKDIWFTTGPAIATVGTVAEEFEETGIWGNANENVFTTGVDEDATLFELSGEKQFNGFLSGKISYKFTEAEAKAAVLKNDYLDLGSNPYAGFWVFGDNSSNKLEYLIDVNGTISNVEVALLDFTGWKYITADLNALPDGSKKFAGMAIVNNIAGRDNGGVFFDDMTTGDITDIDDNAGAVTSYSLDQNYPNPFNPSTRIKFSLPEKAAVTLEIYNLLGQKIAGLISNQEFSSGVHSVNWNASGLSSGIYLYKIKANEFFDTKKMILLK